MMKTVALSLLGVACGIAGLAAGYSFLAVTPAADRTDWLVVDDGEGNRVRMGPGGLIVRSDDGNRVVLGRDPGPVPPAPLTPPREVLAEVTDAAAFTEGEEEDAAEPAHRGAPDWAENPPAGRMVVVGPLESSAARAKAAAVRAAVPELAAAASVPASSVSPRRAGRLVRRSAVEEVTRETAGGNTFTVYRTRLLVDVDARTLRDLPAEYRRALADGRAGVAAGTAAGLAGLFAGVWGVGRRKLRKAGTRRA